MKVLDKFVRIEFEDKTKEKYIYKDIPLDKNTVKKESPYIFYTKDDPEWKEMTDGYIEEARYDNKRFPCILITRYNIKYGIVEDKFTSKVEF